MRARFHCVLIAYALLGFSSSGAAQDEVAEDYVRNGPYLGISAEGAAYTFLSRTLEDELGLDVETEYAAGFSVYGGYRANPNVALEAEFEMMSGADVKVLGVEAAQIETWAVTGNAKIFLLPGRIQPPGLIQPFALVGVGVVHAELKLKDKGRFVAGSSAEGFGARFGGGADCYFTKNIALSVRAAYMFATGDVNEADYFSFGGGLQYRF